MLDSLVILGFYLLDMIGTSYYLLSLAHVLRPTVGIDEVDREECCERTSSLPGRIDPGIRSCDLGSIPKPSNDGPKIGCDLLSPSSSSVRLQIDR